MDRSPPKPRDWDAYYARTAQLPGPDKTCAFLDTVPMHGRVLDFGAGSGRWSAAFLRDRPDVTIDALDQHIDKATLLPASWSGEKIASSFQDFRPTQSYDAIWAQSVLFFLPPDALRPVFHRLACALLKDGVIAFTMVEEGHVSRAAKFHGMTEDAILHMLDEEGLEVTSLMRHPDTRYGTDGLVIPTYDITARKRA